ncbi:RmlC-like cupin domain-containing protein [Aspergillus coremiiformis]|uniref:Cysteine dioxygenase n=1 Tax=Aspergillus coremiiformis TaxID=138285 RepID=A0A5N6Z4A7_9EURO|nr:RmlC-like cupin domain-containing protein [Aspergillus coremiiformis]
MLASVLQLPLPLPQGPPCDRRFVPVAYDLPALVQDIKSYLGDSAGIDSSEVDHEYLIGLARKYISNPNDWLRFFYNDPSKNYTRNAIENINRKANILLLVWNPGKGSPIHDHANAHCIMKVLAGELTETVYHPPNVNDESSPLTLKHQKRYQADQVTYISDAIGLHRVHNPSPNQVAVSLHIYTPPNAADDGYHIFDGATGKASFVSQARARSNTEKPAGHA